VGGKNDDHQLDEFTGILSFAAEQAPMRPSLRIAGAGPIGTAICLSPPRHLRAVAANVAAAFWFRCIELTLACCKEQAPRFRRGLSLGGLMRQSLRPALYP
jgi:hypothetical protein